jgi:phospholipid/cholesterol/gamma-HCH transport system substrate-binding protein
MAAPVRNNVIVALTVIGALVALGWMIVKFGGTLGGLASGGGYEVRMSVPRVDGLAEGARVTYRGTGVGRVTDIGLDEERTGFDVMLLVRADDDRPLPANVRGAIIATNLISGGAGVELELLGEAAEGELRQLASEEPAVIEGRFAGTDLVPPELLALAEEAQQLTLAFREADVANVIAMQAVRLGDLAETIDEVAGDGELRDDLKLAVRSLRGAAEEGEAAAAAYRRLGERANEDFDQILTDGKETLASARRTVTEVEAAATEGRSIIAEGKAAVGDFRGRLAQADRVLGRVESILTKADEGEGTLALMLNDPRAYEALDADLRLLNLILKDARRLVQQIEEEGFKVSIF